MALTYDQITAITEKHFVKKLVNQVYDGTAFLRKLNEQKEVIDGGTKIIAPIISSKPTAGGFFSDFDVLDTSPTDDITACELEWKQLHEPIKISSLEELKNNGDAAKLKLVASKMMVAEHNLKENLSLGLFSDGTASTGAMTTKQITGLRAILSESSTYGGIAVADLAEWAANVEDNSGTDKALTLGLIQKVIGRCTFDMQKPNLIIASQKVFDVMWSLFQPHQRLASEEAARLGFVNAFFNGTPVVVDNHIEEDTLYTLNLNFLKLYVHRNCDMKFEKMTQLESQAATLGRIFWCGNLVCNGRRYQGSLTDIED